MQLVPFLSRYIAIEISAHLTKKNTCYLRALLRVVLAMVSNKSINIGLHLHQLLPPILSCVVVGGEGSFSLREHAARLLVEICNRHGSEYLTISSRILKVFCSAFNGSSSNSLGTQFGGIVGLTLFGRRAIGDFLLPKAMNYWRELEEREKGGEDIVGISACRGVVLRGIGEYVNSGIAGEAGGVLPERVDQDDFNECFAAKLVALVVVPALDKKAAGEGGGGEGEGDGEEEGEGEREREREREREQGENLLFI